MNPRILLTFKVILIAFLFHLPAYGQSDSTFDIQGRLYKILNRTDSSLAYFDHKGSLISSGAALPLSSDLQRKIISELARINFTSYFERNHKDTLSLILSIVTGGEQPFLRIIGNKDLASYDTMIKTKLHKTIIRDNGLSARANIYEMHFFSIRMRCIQREKRSLGYKID